MDKRKKAGIILSVILGTGGLLYLGGILGQLIAGYRAWLGGNGISGEIVMKPPDWNVLVCIRHAFTLNGLKGMATAILLGTAVVLYVKFHDKFDGNEYDPRGFKKSKTGTYGTATWMSEKELKEIMEVTTPARAEGVILGEYDGKTVCMPKDTRLNRCFSTYAYRLIWNEICDALISSTRNGKRETVVDVLPETGDFYDHEDKELQIVLQKILKEAQGLVPASTKKGIRAMLLMEKGYTSREIGERFGVKANLVCAWVSKARKYLREQEELRQMAEEYGYEQRKPG